MTPAARFMPDASDPASPAPRAPRPVSPQRPAQLPDPWSRRGPLPLDGYCEREQFSPLLTALLVLGVGFIAFQVVGALATFGLLVPQMAGEASMDTEAMMDSIGAEAIIGNSVGQAVGLGLLAVLAARLHSRWGGAFLRLRRPPWQAVGLALAGLVTLTPALSWLVQLNQQLPLPESLRFIEDARMQSIRMILESGLGPLANVAGLAAVPALCEELIFRGYAQRQFERVAGVAGGVALTGFLFGCFHFDPLQALPLSVLGTYLAYLTWRSGSIWPAIIVHFVNNAFAVIMTELGNPQAAEAAAGTEGAENWPWYIAAAGLILFAVVLFLLHTRAPQWQPVRAENRAPEGVPPGRER